MRTLTFVAAVLALGWTAAAHAMTLQCHSGCTPENQAVLSGAKRLLPPLLQVAIAPHIHVRFVDEHKGSGSTAVDSNGRLKFPIDVQISTQLSFDKKVRTAIHEISHVYDMLEPLSASERSALLQCSRESIQPECQRLRSKLGRVSYEPQFLALSGWRQTAHGTPELLNQLRSRSPDLNEFKDPLEAFAVAMEFFLLDPDFSCRRPATFRYLRNLFEHDPFPNAPCRSRPIRISQTRDEKEAPDLSRLAGVDLLFAAPGRNLATRWGHVMYRLVICGPDRKEVNAECRKDVSYHLVISPRGAQDDLQGSAWKLFAGGYASEFFILDFPRVVRDYNRTEFRDVELIPLLLNPRELQAFGEAVVERFWGYQGNYALLSNNCATEALTLLQAATGHAGIHAIATRALTPRELVEKIRESGYARTGGEILPSRLGTFLNSIQELGFVEWMMNRYPSRFPMHSENGGPKISETEFALEILEWTPHERRIWGETALKIARSPKATAAHLFVIEDIAEGRLRLQIEQRALKWWWDSKDEVARKNFMVIRPQADPGYGVPLPHEVGSWGSDISQEILELAQSREADLLAKWKESVALKRDLGLRALKP